MSDFFTTFILAIVLVIFCAAGLGIGYILTGKSKLKCGRCGNPEKKKNCDLCQKKMSDEDSNEKQ